MNDTTQRCIGCGAEPPPTNTDFTLVSAQGWRLTPAMNDDGKKVMQWRCPACWARYRRRIGLSKGT
jgi:hypothetical protein